MRQGNCYRRRVDSRFLSAVVATLIYGFVHASAAESAATVTEAVNRVTHGTSTTADSPAKAGTVIRDGEYLKTGVKSRAELDLANQTVTRLGANTIFNYSSASNEIDLQSGTLLFSKPKDDAPMTIKTGAVTAAIVGTTGFVQVAGKGVFLFGLVEGHSHLLVGDIKVDLTGGEVVRVTPGSPPQLFAFNLPLFLKTSPLITKYHQPLPNQKEIDHAVSDYNDLAARGFIHPPQDPFFLVTPDGSVPLIPLPAFDSSGNALYEFQHQPPPPRPPSSNNYSP